MDPRRASAGGFFVGGELNQVGEEGDGICWLFSDISADAFRLQIEFCEIISSPSEL